MEDDTARMAQEDQRNFDGGGGGGGGGGIGGLGRSSKKPKMKKVPQRGLGVAQLERIRLEEQQKRDVGAILPSQSCSSSTTASYLPLQVKNFHHSNQTSSTSPLPCGSPYDFRPPPPSLQQQQHQQQQQQHMDCKVSKAVQLPNNGDFEAGKPSGPVLVHGNVPKWWSSYESDFEKDNFGVDPGFPFPPSLPFESNPVCSLPNWVQRAPQYQHQPSSAMVTVSSGTSPTPVPHFSIEPPSNQNYSGSSLPGRPVENMTGMKRPYPFSLDFPHATAFNYKFSPFAEIRTNTKTSGNNGNGFNFDAGNPTSREVPSCSVSNSESNSKKGNKENENFKGDFLTLAPPSSPTSCPPSKIKSSSTFLAVHNQEYPEFQPLSCQGKVEDQIPTPAMYRLINQQKQQFYSFFLPEAKEEQIGQAAVRIQNGHEAGESIDLNLKL